jgi:hypothetical protein
VRPRLSAEYSRRHARRTRAGQRGGRRRRHGKQCTLRTLAGGQVSAALPFHEEGRAHSPDNLRRNSVFFRLAAQY